jgi:pseudouridine-5'-phosphate glycosidase
MTHPPHELIRSGAIRLSVAVGEALANGRPVVALESTIFSNLGLPAPANADALHRCQEVLRAAGVEPAVTAVLDGVARVGLTPDEEQRVLGATAKLAERDLAVAMAQGIEAGVTTVSATVALAHTAGISVFSTWDISADLDALAHHPVITVCAGAKAFLDLPKTLEYLETVGVPVLGWQHDWFPAFYSRSSGLPVPHRVETTREVVAVLRNRVRPDTGVLLTTPIPQEHELDAVELQTKLDAALAAATAEGLTGAAVTPFILGRIEQETAGESIPANVALALNNAWLAAQVANELASGS